ncbi:unnamed protein product [Pleuronectes platessa]|uniref:Uncharacterized protein n=1 Tax=Pleuronectes platessa TaxID=8262 RepID=A0A9N7ULM1_PLEPL|nr:unnamed protein product [Pleuronectes platessa]
MLHRELEVAPVVRSRKPQFFFQVTQGKGKWEEHLQTQAASDVELLRGGCAQGFESGPVGTSDSRGLKLDSVTAEGQRALGRTATERRLRSFVSRGDESNRFPLERRLGQNPASELMTVFGFMMEQQQQQQQQQLHLKRKITDCDKMTDKWRLFSEVSEGALMSLSEVNMIESEDDNNKDSALHESKLRKLTDGIGPRAHAAARSAPWDAVTAGGRCWMSLGSLTPCPPPRALRAERDSGQTDASRWKWTTVFLEHRHQRLHRNRPGLPPKRRTLTTPQSQINN